jgi:hypothetical protein
VALSTLSPTVKTGVGRGWGGNGVLGLFATYPSPFAAGPGSVLLYYNTWYGYVHPLRVQPIAGVSFG